MASSNPPLPVLILPPPSIPTSEEKADQQVSTVNSKKRKGTSQQHAVVPAEKRMKRMGRPKNGWTATRKRKLIRLYLMTDLDVVEIAQVLRAEGFQPCKRDIQKQLTILLQNRPNQVRSRGSITKTRLRLLRECKDLRSSEGQKRGETSEEARPTMSRENTEGTMSAGLEDLPLDFSLPVDQVIDWSWLDFDTENLPFGPNSPPNLSIGSGTSVASPHSPASNATVVKLEQLTPSPQELPKIQVVSSEYTRSIASPLDVKLSKAESPPTFQTILKSGKTDVTDNSSIYSAGTKSNKSVVSLNSLKKRLHSKYTGSFLYDIKSLMDRLTISDSSDAASIMTKTKKTPRRALPATSEPVIVLPGFFPQYCWEHLNVNQLLRCDDLPVPCTQGPIYSPLGLETHRAMRSDVMFRIRSSSVRKDDLTCEDAFGNSVLHVAASLGARPSYLSCLISMGADVRCLNVAGQSFLHLTYLSQLQHIAEFRFLVGTLMQHGFDFQQQDHNGQTIFHALVQSCMPNEVIDDALQCFRYHGISISEIRDNLGLDVSKRMQNPMFEMLPPPAEEDETPYRTYSMATNTMSVIEEFPSPSYVQISKSPFSPPIENLADLQNYELHADLLRTILRATDTPSFEDTSGRNGLHCLAAVRLDLPVSIDDDNETTPTLKSPKLDLTVRERYLEQLILSGVDTNSYDREGNTPFMDFVTNVRDEEDDNLTSKILGRLCRAGADINRRNRQGETSLHLAVKLGRRAATKFLLARGANVHARTKDGTGILALGHKHSDRASKDDILYAQISLCMSLVASAGAVSSPTILREWASEEFRIAPDRPTPILSPQRDEVTTPTSVAKSGKGYYGKPAYGPWPTLQGKSWVISAK